MPLRTKRARVMTTAVLVAAISTPLTLGSAQNASASKVYDGPDVASYQHPHPTKAHPHGQPINWKKVARSGKDFAIVKATEGTTYVNPYFDGPYYDDYADAAKAGLVHGSYHFARPAFPIVESANAQARLFAHVVGPVTTTRTLPPALDLEVNGGLNPAQLVTWAQTFLLKMRHITGRTPMLYTYPNFWTNDLADPAALARYPLWMAEYGTSRAPVADLWQYTSKAHIKGIVGNVDVSKFVGTSGFPWSTLSNGTVHTPWAAAAPGPPQDPTASVDGTDVTVHWRPGNAGTNRVTSYQVKATPGGETQTVSGSKFSAEFTDLSPQTTYRFTVTGVNSVDSGTPSVPTAPVTPTIPTHLVAALVPTVTYGDPLPLKVTLTRADTKAALADRPVLIYRRSSANAKWHRIRKLDTNDNGHVKTVLTPTHSAQLEAVFPGAKGVARADVLRSYVVRPTVTAALSEASVTQGTAVTMSGVAAPPTSGEEVTRQRLVDGSWRDGPTTTVNHHGQYSFTIQAPATGTYVYRALLPAAKHRGSGHSPRVTLTVS
jgi:GH25 family lysozyme M1 (1,4-beta-N-acetylmuramidase)